MASAPGSCSLFFWFAKLRNQIGPALMKKSIRGRVGRVDRATQRTSAGFGKKSKQKPTSANQLSE
jgi:hypothetical protein